MDFYTNVRRLCGERNTTISATLEKIGRSTALTSKWKKGSDPSAMIVKELADCLNISMDECYCGVSFTEKQISLEDEKWLEIIHNIPEEKHEMLKDFLRTHMIEKYEDQGKNA